MKKASDNSKSDSQFLIVTGLLVVLIGGPTISSLLRDPAPQVPMVTVQSANVNSRAPASVAEVLSDSKGGDTQAKAKNSLVVEFKCDDIVANQEVSTSQVRIAGASCKSATRMSVLNKTNGFSASVIFTNNRKFTTDFIDLKEGKNSFEIVAFANDGSQQTHSMTVIRRAPTGAPADLKNDY